MARALGSMRVRAKRAWQGLALSLGAPLGWLALRSVAGHGIRSEFVEESALYLYLLVATAIVFVGFGNVLGWQEERLLEANRRLSDAVLTDPLTGLKNLRYFRARLEEECAISRRDGSGMALLMIDLDHFKRVNDRYGHPEGDRLLRAVGRAIDSVVRAGETAARVGGEEFGLLLPGASGEDGAAAAERVRAAIDAVRVPRSQGDSISITASVGHAATSDLGYLDPDGLYRAADAALYQAKEQGRDRAVRAFLTV